MNTRSSSALKRLRTGLAAICAIFIASLGMLGQASATELLMFERSGCSWCAAWHEEIGPIYQKTEEGQTAPLHVVDILNPPRSVALARPVAYSPTFVVVQGGKEFGRITGYPGESFFWDLLNDILKRLPAK
jgi:hypothetical protein